MVAMASNTRKFRSISRSQRREEEKDRGKEE